MGGSAVPLKWSRPVLSDYKKLTYIVTVKLERKKETDMKAML
jgi:hypothetical protein